MTAAALQAELLQRVCLGNAEAIGFLRCWGVYVHGIDDIVDTRTDTEFRLKVFVAGMDVFTHPFFLRHGAALRVLILNTTNAYADTERWAKSSVKWQREFAELYRHFAAEMILAVAGIVGGYEHLRAISPEVRAFHWSQHFEEVAR